MDVTLYGAKSTASLVVHWLLIELGIDHSLKQLGLAAGEQKSKGYLAINPAGRVPTLVVDGVAITEAAAIALHLADLKPGAGLAPAPGTPPRAQLYRWMFFCANTLQPAYRDWFYPEEPAGAANVDAAKAEAQVEIEAAWQRVDDHLAARGPYLLGESRSVADFMLVMLARWSRNMPKPADAWPAVAAHAQRMKALPSFAEAYRREGITDWT